MEIVIEKEKIIEELHGMSAHLGNKLSASELIASTADDSAKIEIMLSATLAEVLKLLSPYATLVNNSDEIVYELSMPSNWKTDRANTLAALCENYLVHSLFARWLDFVKSDSAVLYRTLNMENAAAIQHILLLREKPRRD
ncbi:MAG: hypothetical protein IKB11_05365 [Bacteroidaceae bacterium]|nr:hypothetical protein [Bacteroidaceae bacterium]